MSMRPFRPLGVGLLAVTMATVAAPVTSANPPPAINAGSGTSRVLTLITGDQVRLSADQQQVQPIPAAGRTGAKFKIQRFRGHVSVIPLDALPLIGRGRLDPRLFDVTELASAGYDDAHSKELPLLFTYDGSPAAATSTLRTAGSIAQKPLPAINGAAARIPKDKLSGLFTELAPALGAAAKSKASTAAGIGKVWLDGKRTPTLDHSVPQIGAPAAWAAGYTGRGVKVAVLDSGVDAAHPDFAGRLQSENFTPEGPEDAIGHATHVASIVAGSGAASDGRYKGVAPDAELLSGKVCVFDGCEESWILAGMNWAVQQHAKIVNLSLGGGDYPGDDPLEQAVNTLTATTGTLFVVAAGNHGSSAGTVDSPGSAAAALTVGAVDRDDQMAGFSGRGPTVAGLAKPDVTAPGVGIVAAKASNSQIGDPVGTSYLRLSGTSMATPHVAGAAALLAQEHPDWKAGQLKAALMGSAVTVADVPVLTQGNGRIDVAAATKLTVTADTGSLAYDPQQWPHTDDVAQSKDITYTNAAAQPVTLDLTASYTGPDGEPAPAGAVRLSASSVTIPGNGTATVTVTSDTAFAGPDGLYVGSVVARAGTTKLSTALSVHREQESYNLTINHLDRAGAVTGDYLDIILNRQAEDEWPLFLSEEDGTTNVRLPKGQYLLDTTVGQERGRAEASNLVQPKLDLTSDTSITVDARQAKPVTISVPEATARNVFTSVDYTMVTPGFTWFSGVADVPEGHEGARLYTAQVGPSVSGFDGRVTSQWARLDPEGGQFFDNTPYLYALGWPRDGGYFTGFSKVVRPSELATLKPAITAQSVGTTGVFGVMGETSKILGGLGYGYPYSHLPATPSVYVTTEGVSWAGALIYTNGDAEAAFLNSRAVTYRPGRTYRENWGRAVVGPAFPQHSPWVSRTGDTLGLTPPQADSDGHYGQGVAGNGSMVVYRDGVELATLDYPFQAPKDTGFAVPAGPGSYRLEVETAGSGVLDVSTATRTSWTFKSTTTAGTTALPLWAVRFLPGVDGHNVLRTGRTHVLPIVAQAQQGSAVGKLKTVKVQTSTDDGKTWLTAPVRTTAAGKFAAVVTVPDGATYVSVRAQAADSKGNTVQETITRAYKVAR
ncbi:S8 family peptidase [Kribbella qitaiheensis]|uniref:S8 family peptidase n=1 Tax=Kribbella qitaiheensis TaxID=1544730 RepID=A0A7G6WYK9_9ACTN|nr:S8 family peptidase [Kribbella qitaiheensis]QNE19074.1 S8 family peptidase [Kribbella qitaiheensis]